MFEKIVLSDDSKLRIIENGITVAAQRKKRQKKRCYTFSVFLALGIISFLLQSIGFPYQETLYPIKVYAQETSEIILSEQEEFFLEKTQTPLGFGYKLYAATDAGYHYTNTVEDIGYGIDTIFSDKNHIYWVPDYWKNIDNKIYDEKGTQLDNSGATKDYKARVSYCVYDEQNILRMKIVIELSENAGKGSGKILKLISYPKQL